VMIAASALPGAQAQSSYTMSILSKPSALKSAGPFALDNAGNAYGGGTYLFKTTYAYGGIGSCWVCREYRYQDVKWPASTAATVSGTLGIKDFLVQLASGDGATLVGPTGASAGDATGMVPSVSPFGAPWFNALPSVGTAIKRGTTLTKLKPPLAFMGFTAEAMNSAGTLVGQNYLKGTFGSTSGPVAMVYQGGSFRTLDANPPDGQQYAAGINNSQVAVATVYATNPSTGQREGSVTQWALGGARRAKLGGLSNVMAEGINNAGQVLMHGIPLEAPWPIATHIWQNDVLTPVTGTMVQDQSVLGAAINDSGTVVGCLYNSNQSLSRAVHTPFIWRNGVMENLGTYLAGKGVTLPSGTALGCPYAINNSGTILAYTYRVSNEASTTWVRFNAKP
jgi:uncharacterized membrane protein